MPSTPTPLSGEDREAIRLRRAAATPGQLEATDYFDSSQYDMIAQCGLYFVVDFSGRRVPDGPVEDWRNADFIANCYTDIPKLLTEVQRLTTENESLQGRLDKVAEVLRDLREKVPGWPENPFSKDDIDEAAEELGLTL